MADKDQSTNLNSEEQKRMHDAYAELGHKGGEIGGHKGGEARKEEMARGEIFTKENPSNPDQPPAGKR